MIVTFLVYDHWRRVEYNRSCTIQNDISEGEANEDIIYERLMAYAGYHHELIRILYQVNTKPAEYISLMHGYAQDASHVCDGIEDMVDGILEYPDATWSAARAFYAAKLSLLHQKRLVQSEHIHRMHGMRTDECARQRDCSHYIRRYTDLTQICDEALDSAHTLISNLQRTSSDMASKGRSRAGAVATTSPTFVRRPPALNMTQTTRIRSDSLMSPRDRVSTAPTWGPNRMSSVAAYTLSSNTEASGVRVGAAHRRRVITKKRSRRLESLDLPTSNAGRVVQLRRKPEPQKRPRQFLELKPTAETTTEADDIVVKGGPRPMRPRPSKPVSMPPTPALPPATRYQTSRILT